MLLTGQVELLIIPRNSPLKTRWCVYLFIKLELGSIRVDFTADYFFIRPHNALIHHIVQHQSSSESSREIQKKIEVVRTLIRSPVRDEFHCWINSFWNLRKIINSISNFGWRALLHMPFGQADFHSVNWTWANSSGWANWGKLFR